MKDLAKNKQTVVNALSDKELAASCLVHLYHSQTDSERSWRATTDSNRVGFNTADAPRLTHMAEWLEWRGGELTDFEHRHLCSVLPKYWRQLLPICCLKETGPDASTALDIAKGNVYEQ